MQACSTFSLLMKSSFAHSQEMKKDQFCFSLSVKHDHINWQCSFVYPLYLTLPDQYKFSWLKGKLKDEYAVQVNTGLLQCSFNVSVLCISLNKLLVGITHDSLNRSSLRTLSSHLTEVMSPGTWVMSHKILVIRYTWLFWGGNMFDYCDILYKVLHFTSSVYNDSVVKTKVRKFDQVYLHERSLGACSSVSIS